MRPIRAQTEGREPSWPSIHGYPAGTVFVTEPSDNGNPLIGILDLSNGVITPFANHLINPKGLIYVAYGRGRVGGIGTKQQAQVLSPGLSSGALPIGRGPPRRAGQLSVSARVVASRVAPTLRWGRRATGARLIAPAVPRAPRNTNPWPVDRFGIEFRSGPRNDPRPPGPSEGSPRD